MQTTQIKIDYSLVTDIKFDGIDPTDYPDFSDAYIISATYKNREITEEELDLLNSDRDFVYEELMNYLY